MFPGDGAWHMFPGEERTLPEEGAGQAFPAVVVAVAAGEGHHQRVEVGEGQGRPHSHLQLCW